MLIGRGIINKAGGGVLDFNPGGQFGRRQLYEPSPPLRDFVSNVSIPKSERDILVEQILSDPANYEGMPEVLRRTEARKQVDEALRRRGLRPEEIEEVSVSEQKEPNSQEKNVTERVNVAEMDFNE